MYATSLLTLVLAAAPAAETSGAPDADLTVLVRRLGDESFTVRDDAARRLLLQGRSAEKALRQGLADSDPEVRHQCEQLLALATRSEFQVALDAFLSDGRVEHVQKLPAWNRFRTLVGDSAASRSLFVAV